MSDPLYRKLAALVAARLNCIDGSVLAGANEWKVKHEEAIRKLVREHMPRGSGIDSGTTIDLDASTTEKLVFDTSFHHMDEHGSYDGWTEHRITVRASLVFTIDLKISGPNRNEIKDYLHDVFREALTLPVGE